MHCSITPDPFPGVVIESMLAGAATIATRAGGVTEMIDSPNVGVLYSPGNAGELSHHLQRLLEQVQSPRAVFGVPARSRALELVDAKSVDTQMDGLYRRVLGNGQVHGYLQNPRRMTE